MIMAELAIGIRRDMAEIKWRIATRVARSRDIASGRSRVFVFKVASHREVYNRLVKEEGFNSCNRAPKH